MMHVKSALLRGTVLNLHPAPERKDADPATLGPEIKKAVDDLTTLFGEMRTKNEDRLKQIEKKGEDAVTKAELDKIDKAIGAKLDSINGDIKKRVDELEAKANRLALGEGGGPGRKAKTPDQIEYDEKFEAFFRNGEEAAGGKHALRELERKATAATTDTQAAGGFTVRPEMENMIDETLKQISPIRSIATVRTISGAAYQKLVNTHGTSSGWVGERESRTQTLAPDLVALEFPAMEIYAMPAASQNLLDDSYINIDQWLADEVDLEFAAQEGAAFVNGTGTKKPRGFIGGYTPAANASYAWGNPGYVATGLSADYAASAPADALIDLVFALKKGYRNNGTFVMNRKTMGRTRKLKDGQGNYLVDLRLRDNALVETMFGYPVVEAEDMPDYSTASAYAVAFGDFKRGYLIVDRAGIRVLRDPYTSKPYVLFYTTKRVGGGIQNFEAIKLLKFAAS